LFCSLRQDVELEKKKKKKGSSYYLVSSSVCRNSGSVFKTSEDENCCCFCCFFFEVPEFSWRQAVYRHLFPAVESSEEVVYVLGRSTRNSRSFEYE